MQNDLISRSALLKEFEKRQKAAVDGVFADCFLNDAQNLSTEWWMVDDIVEAAPTIDAVEVVRCRECKERWETLMLNDGWVHCKKWGMPTKSDGFCHKGKRMDGGAADGSD